MGADDVGTAVKSTQSGSLPIGTVKQILERAPQDLLEQVLEIPEWNCSVKVRSLTSAQSAAVKEAGFGFKGEETKIDWAEMEQLQFQMGVIEPQFSNTEVKELYFTSGRGFQRVINWLDEKSNIDKEALEKVKDEFRGSKQRD